VSAYTPYMRLFGAKVADAGYSIVPIAAAQKWPGEYSNGKWWPMRGWEFQALTKTPEVLVENVWSQWPGTGIGICCGGQSRVIGVDIDILDAEISGNIRRKIEELLGPTPLVRVGQAPKVMLVYRTTEKMEKLSFHPIEVLASGQQFVGWGVHPKTGQPYTWESETPAETPVESLPLVTPERVREAVEAAYATIPEEMRAKRLQSSDAGQDAGRHVPSGDTSPATLEAIREVLTHIPNPDLPWEDFKRVIMATFAASHGNEDAYFELLKWSRQSGKHDDGATRREWTTCRSSPPRSVGFGTLHYLATQNGWVPSAGLAFNTAKDVSDVDISGFDEMPFAEASVSIPVMPKPPRATVKEKLAAAPAAERPAILASVGLAEAETVNPDTGEVVSHVYPVIETGGQTADDFVTGQLQMISEDTTKLFHFEEPQALSLTQEEIEHGTLPKEFIDQFPQEWLYTSSLIGQMAAWVESACPISHRVFALMASFTAFASLVGRQYKTTSDLRPNLACIIIAGTGSGKEGPRNAITKLFLAADAAKYIGPRGGFSSGSGVVEGIRNQPNMWLAVDEFGKKIAAYGNGKVDQNQREMIALFLEALVNDYIGGKGYANSVENPTKNIRLPNLNIFGSSQVGEITGALSSAAAADGLIQRFLFVPTFAEYVPIKKNFEKPPVPQTLIDSFKWLIADLAALGGEFATNDDPTTEPNQRLVAMTQQAQDLFTQLDQRRVDMARVGRVMWVRSAAMSVKVAMLEAIARDPISPVIDAELLDSSRKLVDWFTLYAETFLASRIADSDTQRDINRLREIIAEGKDVGVTLSEVTRKTQSMRRRDREDHLKTLIESGQVYEQVEASTGGRAAKRFKIAVAVLSSTS
jgi:hypothetical protein